jgi:hypothetical protein
VEPAPFVECPSCKHLVPASEPRDLVASNCPSCGKWSPLLEGSSFVFLCASCEGGTRTYFALDEKGRPFSVYGLKRILIPEQPSNYNEFAYDEKAKVDTELKKFTRSAIETALQEGRQVLSRQEEEARLRIPRFCLAETCRKYLWEQSGGAMKCVQCSGPLVQLATVFKVCVNPRCTASELDPRTAFIPIQDMRCKRCGHPAGKKPGIVREEGIYE